jgi:hypothetical protein
MGTSDNHWEARFKHEAEYSLEKLDIVASSIIMSDIE